MIPEARVYHYKARTYSPGLGRFLQVDPAGFAGGVNLYAYAGNNPVNGSDPSGMTEDPDGPDVKPYYAGGPDYPTPNTGVSTQCWSDAACASIQAQSTQSSPVTATGSGPQIVALGAVGVTVVSTGYEGMGGGGGGGSIANPSLLHQILRNSGPRNPMERRTLQRICQATAFEAQGWQQTADQISVAIAEASGGAPDPSSRANAVGGAATTIADVMFMGLIQAQDQAMANQAQQQAANCNDLLSQ